MDGLFEPTHLIFILLIVLIIFGPGKLPDLGRGFGKAIREFKDSLKGEPKRTAVQSADAKSSQTTAS